MAKKRLDVYLTENNLVQSRSVAQAMIMAGNVFVDNQKADKAGLMISGEENIEVRGKTLKYVSRGGLKLEKALETFPIDINDKICMDIGASTGGFTDCMLQNGAKKVFAVDVGYGQLAWSLRQSEKVVNMERTNIRYVTLEDIGEKLDFFSVDVAFISLKLVLPVAFELLKDNGEGVCLIKPQFEAGRDKVGKKGVVRDINVHKEVIRNVLEFTKEMGFCVKAVDFSPVRGPEGNIEYLMYVKKCSDESAEIDVDKIVDMSHELAI